MKVLYYELHECDAICRFAGFAFLQVCIYDLIQTLAIIMPLF